jgi:hypothetical protein
MGIETILGAGSSIVGGMMGSDAAEDAADAQIQASREATRAQREMFDKQVELQKPWRDAGGLGLNRLAYELGLSKTPVYSTAGPMETEAQIRQRLQSQYMRSATPGAAAPAPAAAPVDPNVLSLERIIQMQGGTPQTGPATWMNGNDSTGINGFAPAPSGAAPTLDQAGLDAAVQAELQRQQAALAAQGASADYGGAEYGNLLKTFGKDDFEADPGYAWRKEEQERALLRSAAANGGVGSGKYLKDAMKYSGGLAAQEYGAAFDRFNVGQTNKFNRLASISGIGQTAANQTGAAAANFGAQMGNNIIGAGNAQAAGRIGGANALMGGIGQGVSMYQQNSLMNQFGGGYGGTPINGGGGFGTGASFGNQDYGQYF